MNDGDPTPLEWLPLNPLPPKPRSRAVTEIRGPYYSPVGIRYLEDMLDAWGRYVDVLKFAGGSFALMPRRVVRAIVDACHARDARVSTGGFIERVLPHGPDAVGRYLTECHDLGFDLVEVSAGFVTLPHRDFLRLLDAVRDAGLTPRPEVGIQPGAGGASAPHELHAVGTRDVEDVVRRARDCLDRDGVDFVTLESEGLTESVREWRTDTLGALARGIGVERVVFEAADPAVFRHLVSRYGPDVNLFVDHAQVAELAALRRGAWGPSELWGRVVGYSP